MLVFHTLTVLIDTQTQAASYFLAAGDGGFLLNQGTNLEYIGIVPAFLQCGVGENNAQWAGKAQ